MRKFIILLGLIFLTELSIGQMVFNNMEMGVPYHNFRLDLIKKGYIFRSDPVKEAENTFSYSGKFINKDANIEVMVTPNTKIVWKVSVELPESNSWDGLKSEFFDLCKKMTQKYGRASKFLTSFLKPYAEGDGNELQAIYNGKCTYFYNWKTENGLIGIAIISHKEEAALINIWYEDKDASATNSEEKNKVIMDGL